MKNLFVFALIAGVVLGVAIYLTSETEATSGDELASATDIEDFETSTDRSYNAMS